MDLKDFVAASLRQILDGVAQAQAGENGANINAEGAGIPDGKNVFSNGTYGNFTIVEFDVAVSAETAGKGGANLQVFGVGFEGGGEHRAGRANRISFAIPVRLPNGDKSRAQRIADQFYNPPAEQGDGWNPV